MTIIPKGYKKTEVGIIPNSWEVLELGAVATYSKGRLSASLVDEYSYVSCENMRKNKGGVSFPASVPSSGSVVKYNGGDILLGNIRPYLEKIWLANKIGACSTDVLCLQPNIDSVFLYNVLSKDSFFLYVMSNVKGTKMPRGDKKHIAQYRFAAPTNQGEQHAIATVLSDLDALIEAKTALLEKKRAIKLGAMQELLTGRRRLPGFPVTPMKKTDIGEIPEDWEVCELGACCKLYQPKTLSQESLKDFGEFPVYGANGVIGYHDQYNHEFSEIIITCRGNTCGVVNFSLPFSWINGNAMVTHVQSWSKVSQRYLLHHLKFSSKIGEAITGGAQPQITREPLGHVKISYPVDKTEQESIVVVLSDMDKDIDSLVTEISKLRNLKQGMMQELLTGRIRLVK